MRVLPQMVRESQVAALSAPWKCNAATENFQARQKIATRALEVNGQGLIAIVVRGIDTLSCGVMAQGLFISGFSVAEVLAIQARAKEMLLEGKTLMSWGDSGTSVSKQFPMTIKETLEECAQALRVLDPATYGTARRVAQSRVGHIFK